MSRDLSANNKHTLEDCAQNDLRNIWKRNLNRQTNNANEGASLLGRLKNISQVTVFTELVRKKLPEGLQRKTIIDNIANKQSFSLRSPKYNEETKEHVRVKRALLPKDGPSLTL
ncbi:hypothetical protein RhiirA4_456697 [Rhizophagus irregularis]|uniref:Uncharacterized protein n=1 Tax=Rhizophagus irregularis TaxID=588596 RepID=A0A2I1G8B2_9GLOM|nr:hypothetical protein RhiirA4_456697 [Rhizophagus irregularis]